ncbi:MAG: OsmC family protein [Chloroflexota bacterium]|jgi:osmotically inducible protein OsmC|nr:OsmC family protein [Anaerolineae bacterium]HMM27057.1 OsmC family protein [Aggregatilineaceae bacterium]
MPVRHAEAVWNGSFREGSGTMKFGGGAFEGPYSAGSRFEEEAGTNPEELLGAAHAGCFSMAFALGLNRAGFEPEEIRTTADVHIERGESGYRVTRVDLKTRARIPGIDRDKFMEHAEAAKKGCPVSQLFQGAEITLDAQLES